MPVLSFIELIITVIGKTMDHIPNYEQNKKAQYRELVNNYLTSVRIADELRDDNLVQKNYNALTEFLDAFSKEINQ